LREERKVSETTVTNEKEKERSKKDMEHKKSQEDKDVKERYCWNCRKTVKTEESEVRDFSSDRYRDVVFCYQCNAVLFPERIKCGCGKLRRGFIMGVMIHSGATNTAICKECIISDYITERRKGMGLE
jgi:hypothetical protein